MEATKTETLWDVIRDLSSHAPGRFCPQAHTSSVYIKAGRTRHRMSDDGSQYTRMFVQIACQEEIADQGWDMSLDYDSDHRHWDATIIEPSEQVGGVRFRLLGSFDAPEPADALATALREAFRSQS